MSLYTYVLVIGKVIFFLLNYAIAVVSSMQTF